MLWSDVRIANRCGYLVLVDTASQISRELTRCFVSLPNVSTDIYSCRISAAWKCFRGDIRVHSGLCGWDDTMDRIAGARPCDRRFAGVRFRAQSWICRHNGFGFSRHSFSGSCVYRFVSNCRRDGTGVSDHEVCWCRLSDLASLPADRCNG